MIYVADTHAFLWFLTEDEKLGNKAKDIFLEADKGKALIIIPSIILLESLQICEKYKIAVRFKQILEKIGNSLNYVVYPLNLEIVIRCEELEQLDLHDRILVATTQILNSKLLTKDKGIKESQLVETIWS